MRQWTQPGFARPTRLTLTPRPAATPQPERSALDPACSYPRSVSGAPSGNGRPYSSPDRSAGISRLIILSRLTLRPPPLVVDEGLDRPAERAFEVGVVHRVQRGRVQDAADENDAHDERVDCGGAFGSVLAAHAVGEQLRDHRADRVLDQEVRKRGCGRRLTARAPQQDRQGIVYAELGPA